MHMHLSRKDGATSVPDEARVASSGVTAARSEGMFRELLAIHRLLRRDLAIVRRLAREAEAGEPAEAILTQVRSLQSTSPLWQLKFGCLHYCRFVHTHHTIEDAAVFPMIRRHQPALAPMIDRLEEDHLTVHHITERIAAAAAMLPGDEGPDHRAELVATLGELEEHLLAHLALEEESIGPLLSTWDHWPVE